MALMWIRGDDDPERFPKILSTLEGYDRAVHREESRREEEGRAKVKAAMRKKKAKKHA